MKADLDNAQALMAEFLSATEPATVLVQTHRLYEMHRMDEIVVLEQGRVVERGKPPSIAGQQKQPMTACGACGLRVSGTPCQPWSPPVSA